MTISKIQFRRGTTAQWVAEDPILSLGEPGIELKTDNSIAMKIGDGSTAWSTLEYAFSDEFATQSDIATAIANLVDSAPTTLDTLNELATALGDDPNFATTILTELSGKADSSHTHAISEVSNLQNLLNGKAPITKTVSNKSGMYSLLSTDNGSIITNSGPLEIDLGQDPLSPGDSVDFVQTDTDKITFNNLDLVTIDSNIGFSNSTTGTASQYSMATLLCISSGAYILLGDIS